MRSTNVVAGETGFVSQYGNLRHDARGASFLLPHQQLGAIALPTNPSNGQTLTLTINGNAVVITLVTGTVGTTPGNVLIQSTAALTAAAVLALLNQPQTTNANAVALSTANQTLVSYLSWSLVGTTITPCSSNTSLYAPLSSFTVSTTITGASWTAQAMQLYVEPGVVYVNGTRVIFSGGSSPTVTAPSSHPRIDLLTIDNTGALALVTGTENVSPSAPSYPADKVVLCEIYNVVGETALYDIENQQTGQGYVYHDVRPILGLQFNPSAIPDTLLPDADGTRNLGSLSFEWNNLYVKSAVYIGGVQVGTTVSMVAGQAFTTGQPAYIATDTHCAALAKASSQYLHSAGSNLGITGDMTLEGWFYFSSTPSSGNGYGLLSKYKDSNRGYQLSLVNTSGTLQLEFLNSNSGSNQAVTTNWTPSTSTWYHIAVVFHLSAGTAQFYVNGAAQGTLQSGLNTTVSASTADFAIGAIFNGAADAANEFFDGRVDAVRVWNVARTGGAIAADYNLILSGGETNLVAYWTLNQDLTDWGPSAYTLTNTNGATFSTGVAGLTSQGYARIAGSALTDTSDAFVGFATQNVAQLATGAFAAANTASGLSGLTPAAKYYLNDTPGTIGTSPGTVTRKVGIAISTSVLVVTNIW
jgi:Concanavalin A-like lectin/glucanases superfamily